MTKKPLFILIFFLVLTEFSSAKEYKPGFSFLLKDVRTYTLIDFIPLPSGIDFGLVYTKPIFHQSLVSSLILLAGGGFEHEPVFRYEDGSPYTGSYGEGEVDFDVVNAYAKIGMFQQLWESADGKQDFQAFFLVSTLFKYFIDNEALFFTSVFSDNEGLLSNSFFAGLSYDSIREDTIHETMDGIYAEVSAEWAPPFFFNSVLGESDYLRINAKAKGFLTLFVADPEKDKNVFSLYLSDYVSFDWITGSIIPMMINQTFGGIDWRPGTGGSVRGFEKRAYDTTIKAVNNLELRATGPPIIHPSIVPFAGVFIDAGVYGSYAQDPLPSDPGFLLSSGLMVAFDFFDLTYVRVTVSFPLYGERIDGGVVALDFNLGLHF